MRNIQTRALVSGFDTETTMTSGTRAARWLRTLVATLGVVLVGTVASTPAQAQIPPSVAQFLDLKCYRITNPDGSPLPPLNFPLHLDHLNPLFQQLQIPPEDVILLDPFQLCVPVEKNGMMPPPDALQYIQFIDLKCYHMQTDTTALNLLLVLGHLNPVLHQFLPESVSVQDPQKVCVPVAKSLSDGTPFLPPPTILQSIQFIDQKGYGILDPNGNPLPPLGFPIHLDHLNPLLGPPVAPPEDVVMDVPQQLTVPIEKNGQSPSAVDLPVISQIDEKCYALLDSTTGGPPPPLNLPQKLWHLNPVLQTLDPEPVLIQEPQQLCVPVVKQLPGTTVTGGVRVDLSSAKNSSLSGSERTRTTRGLTRTETHTQKGTAFNSLRPPIDQTVSEGVGKNMGSSH